MISKTAYYVIASFIVALLVNIFFFLLLFGSDRIPLLFPDSSGYISVAKQFNNFELPNFSQRTFVYPLYLSVFTAIGNLKAAVYGQVVIGALSVSILYLIIAKLTHNSRLVFLITAIAGLDYYVIFYQSAIISETIAVFVVLSFIYAHTVKINQSLSFKSALPLFLIDLLVIFTRPIYVLLPISVYFYHIFLNRFSNWNKREIKKNLTIFLIGIGINLFVVAGWSYFNYARYGFFGFSDISDINLLGKIVQYNYIDTELTSAPFPADMVIKIKKENPSFSNPYLIINQLKTEGVYSLANLKKINRFFLRDKKIDFAFMGIISIPTAFYGPRTSDFASILYSQADLNNLNILILFTVILADTLVNPLRFIAIFFTLIGVVYFRRRKDDKRSQIMAILAIIILYNVTVGSLLVYGNYSRHLVPIYPILNSLILLMFLSLIPSLRKQLIK